nr:lethal(3)malignant brain tumor-like protein 4 [Danio rerio]|eukprot:XP_021325920.1 lethal(3)malignant brain tumor-like protein 4 [Danio rerio]
MQSEERRKKKASVSPRGVSEEYSLRERPKDENPTKMKNKVSTSQVSGKKKLFSWDQYLEEKQAEAAPLTLFTEFQGFPETRNGFKVGMRLEGGMRHQMEGPVVVTDNASNMTMAAQLAGMLRVKCFVHAISLPVCDQFSQQNVHNAVCRTVSY